MFEASRRRINTFSDFKVSNASRYAEHDVHLQMPILEWTGPGLSEITFKMVFTKEWNNDPFAMLTLLRLYMATSFVAPILVGNRPVTLGWNLFVLTNISEEHKYYDARGDMFWAEADVTLKEYRLLI